MDNLYPDGLPGPGHPELAERERRLDDLARPRERQRNLRARYGEAYAKRLE